MTLLNDYAERCFVVLLKLLHLVDGENLAVVELEHDSFSVKFHQVLDDEVARESWILVEDQWIVDADPPALGWHTFMDVGDELLEVVAEVVAEAQVDETPAVVHLLVHWAQR